MIAKILGCSWPVLAALIWSLSTPPASATEDEDIEAELRCNSPERDSVFQALYEAEDRAALDPQVGLEATEELIEICPEDISLALRRFQFVTRLENPSDTQILDEFERVATAFELSKRGIIPGPIRRPVEYLTARNLEVARCLELLELALVKLRIQHEAEPWESVPEERATRGVQSYRISEARVLLLMGRAHLALDSPQNAAAVAERMHALVLEIDAGPNLGANVHRGYIPLYWTLLGEIAEEEGELPDAFAFYQRAESYPVQLERKESQAKRVWLLMGGTDDGWTASSETNPLLLPVP